jgi:hypothetical protein
MKADAAADKARAKAERPAWKKKRFIIPGVLVLLIALVAVTSGGDEDLDTAEPVTATGDDAADETATDADDEAAEEEGIPEEVPDDAEFAGIGEEARDGDFAFTVTAFECVGDVLESDNEFVDPAEAQGQFCILDIVVENIGSAAQSLSATNQYLYDAEERQFSADSSFEVIMVMETPIFDEINPGNSMEGRIVFDVPTDATIEFAELHDSPFSGGVLVDLR